MGTSKNDEFIRIAVESGMLYNSVRGRLWSRGLDIRSIYTSKDDFANDVFVNFSHLIEKYDENKGTLLNWLVSTLPSEILWKKSKRVREVPFVSEIHANEEVLPSSCLFGMLRPSFMRMYFLSDDEASGSRQKTIAHLFYNQGYSIVKVAEFLGLEASSVRRTLRRVDKKMGEKMKDPLNFLIYLCLPSFDGVDLSSLCEEEKVIATMLYGEGVSPYKIALRMGAKPWAVMSMLRGIKAKLTLSLRAELSRAEETRRMLLQFPKSLGEGVDSFLGDVYMEGGR